jgi:acetolactate synthase-1/2/3 large subunit
VAGGTRYTLDFAAIARACLAEGITVHAADELGPALATALRSGRPTVIDVPMRNTPVLTPGAWDIERIYQVAR